MKKLLPILLVTVVLTALITACGKQATTLNHENHTDPTLYISVTNGKSPNEYQAAVSAANNPGIAGYNLALEFDNDSLVPVSVEEGDALKSGILFSSNLMGASEDKIDTMNAVTTVWAAPSDNSNNGVLYTVTFRSMPSASSQTELSLISRGIGNAAENTVDFDLQGAKIDFNSSADNTESQGWAVVLALLLPIAVAFTWLVLRHKKRQKLCYTESRR